MKRCCGLSCCSNVSLGQLMCLPLAIALRAVVLLIASVFGCVALVRLTVDYIKNPATFFKVKSRPRPPACVNDPRYGTHSIAKVNDIYINYVANGKKGAPLMILLHGFPETWWSWRHQLPVFGETHYVVAVDMRGYGDSSKPRGACNYSEDALAADVRALILHLGYEKAVVVGHDWGAAVAWKVAATYPEIVAKLIVMNCPPASVMINYVCSKKNFLRVWYIFFFQLPFLPELNMRVHDMERLDLMIASAKMGITDRELLSGEDVEVYKHAFGATCDAWTYPLNYYRAKLSTMALARVLERVITGKGNKERIKPKTLIIWGTKDPVLIPALAPLSQAVCVDAEVQLIEGASHWVQQHNPFAVNAAMSKFLQSH